MNNLFEVTFLGTGGSCSYNNGSRMKYGTNTPCVAVKAGKETIILDAGSGICGFSDLEDYQSEHLHVFFSHYHMDHINGLPFFTALFDAKKKIDLYGAGNKEGDLYNIVDRFISPPMHPVGIGAFGAKLGFHTLEGGDSLLLPNGAAVHTFKLFHPGGSLGYRVEYGGKALCYCTDIELSRHQNDSFLEEFIHNADLLILDAYFDDNKIIRGWGHSSWRECAEWAERSKVKKLALFHYGFAGFDIDIKTIEEKARKIFPDTIASADFMQIRL